MGKKNTKTKTSEGVELKIVPDTREQVREGLLQSAIALGLEEIASILEDERAEFCGPRHARSPERTAVRNGTAPGELVLGGRRVSMRRPRARTRDGEEVMLPSWEHFADEDVLHERAMEQMLVGVSTRKYGRSLEPVGESVETRGTSRSAVSRRFVAGTAKRLTALLERRLDGIQFVALMIDGIVLEDHTILVALGIDSDGKKHPLGLREGATENSTSCKELLADLIDRGLAADRALLVVIDGAKALRKAVTEVFGNRALVQRCQEHKMRNVTDQLPDDMRKTVRRAMQDAYRTRDVGRAKKLLTNLQRSLEAHHPGAASSLAEGLDETLTIIAFDLPELLERTLATTNPIENLMGTVRRVSRNVKRWRDGQMMLRWVAAGLLEGERTFRRVKGHKGIPRLLAALREHEIRIGVAVEHGVA
jgi:transposase-like protein